MLCVCASGTAGTFLSSRKSLCHHSLICRRKIITDNVAFARTVLAAGFRPNFAKTALSTILPEEIEAEVKEAAEISMGTEVCLC